MQHPKKCLCQLASYRVNRFKNLRQKALNYCNININAVAKSDLSNTLFIKLKKSLKKSSVEHMNKI